jgi:hypothetical protein
MRRDFPARTVFVGLSRLLQAAPGRPKLIRGPSGPLQAAPGCSKLIPFLPCGISTSGWWGAVNVTC